MRWPFGRSGRDSGPAFRFDEDEPPGRPRPGNAWRVLLVAVVIANLVYFTWTRGGLAVFGTLPARLTESDARRLAQQVRPQMLKILKDDSAAVNR